MFSKLAVVFVATLAAFAVAAPGPRSIENSCNTGKMHCCEDTYDASPEQCEFFKTLFNLDVKPNTKIGVTCSPIVGLGVGHGSSCSAQPVCCENNEFNGVVVVGCSPINVNL